MYIYIYGSPPPKPTFSVDTCIGNTSQQKWRLQNAWVLLRRLSPCRQQRFPPVGWRSVGQIWWYCCQGLKAQHLLDHSMQRPRPDSWPGACHCTWSSQFHLPHWWESFSRSGTSRKRPSWGSFQRQGSPRASSRNSWADRRTWSRNGFRLKVVNGNSVMLNAPAIPLLLFWAICLTLASRHPQLV